jgi:hypothetical protein
MDTSGSFGLTFIHSLPKSMPITDADDPEASSTKPAIAALICIVVLPSLNDSGLLALLAKKFDGHAAPYATKTEVDGTSYGTLIKSFCGRRKQEEGPYFRAAGETLSRVGVT